MTTDTYTEKIEKLTPEDIAQFNKQAWATYVGIIVLAIFLWMLIRGVFSLYDMSLESKSSGLGPIVGFLALCCLIPAYGLYYLVKQIVMRKKELAKGEKIVLTGMLTDKKVEVSTSSSDSSVSDSGPLRGGGGSSSSSTSTTYTYYIYMGKVIFEVDEKKYHQATRQKIASVHYTPLTRKVVLLEQ